MNTGLLVLILRCCCHYSPTIPASKIEHWITRRYCTTNPESKLAGLLVVILPLIPHQNSMLEYVIKIEHWITRRNSTTIPASKIEHWITRRNSTTIPESKIEHWITRRYSTTIPASKIERRDYSSLFYHYSRV